MTNKRSLVAAAGIAGCGLALSLLWLLQGPAQLARAAEYCVSSYASIQAAIAAAGDGDTVLVPTGLYTETLMITENLRLQGGWNSGCSSRTTTDPAQTVIDGDRAGPVVTVAYAAVARAGRPIEGGLSRRGGRRYAAHRTVALLDVIVTGNTLSEPTTLWTYGAGVALLNSQLTMTDTSIVGNVGDHHPSAIALGGGIYVGWQGSVIMTATEIVSNVADLADDVRGGGIFAVNDAVFDLRGTENIVAHNSASYGGGIYMRGDSDLIGALIVDNYAYGYGGGVAVYPGAGGIFANNVITGNGAFNRGSGLYIVAADVEVANNTFVDNAGPAGVGIEIGNGGTSVVTITNNVIVSHVVGIRNLHATISPTLVTNDLWSNSTDYFGVAPGGSDLHVDPEFVALGSGDYHLKNGSPLIDAGSLVPWLRFDFEGDARRLSCFVDIGADEFTGGADCQSVYLPLVLRSF